MKGKKLVKRFTLKPQIFSEKPETSQQEEKEKEKKERKQEEKFSHTWFLTSHCEKDAKKKKPNHAVSKNPVSNH